MRKHKIVTIDNEGRDRGKSFLIVEKSAYDTEKWATRALLAMSRNGTDVSDEMLSAGSMGVLMAGLSGLGRLQFDDAEPLLDEMMACIHFVPDISKVDQMSGRPITRAIMPGDDFNDGDIAEVSTLFQLRQEVLELHLGFSIAAVLSNLAAAIQNLSQHRQSTSPAVAPQPSQEAEPA